MKKSIILMAGLVGLALTSCKEDNSLGTMQKNEAPIIVLENGVALQSLFNATGNSINLQDYQGAAQIPLVDIEIDASFPENSTITGEVEIADNADFNNAQTISLSAVEAADTNESLQEALDAATRSYTGVVNCTAWNDAFVTFYGLNPAANVNFVRYRLWLSNEKQNVILYDNNGNEWFDPMEFMVTPLDAQLDVAQAYTLTYTVNGVPTTVDMYHNPETHVYDNPVFNAMVEVPEDGEGAAEFTWTISPATDAGVVFGVEGDDPSVAEGTLAEGAPAGEILIPGTYKIEANMLEKTFTVKIAPPTLFVMFTGGQFNKVSQLSTTDYISYEGVAGVTNKWVLTGQSNYRPTLYVNDADIAADTSAEFTTKGGLLYSNGGATAANDGGINYSGAGLYFITANLQALTYESYFCKSLGITGSMAEQNWANGNDIKLTSKRSELYLIWTGTLTVNAGDEWKIRANGNEKDVQNPWKVNFGSASDGSYTADGSHIAIKRDGGNFTASESGTFNVTVYFNGMTADGGLEPYYMTVTPAQ